MTFYQVIGGPTAKVSPGARDALDSLSQLDVTEATHDELATFLRSADYSPGQAEAIIQELLRRECLLPRVIEDRSAAVVLPMPASSRGPGKSR